MAVKHTGVTFGDYHSWSDWGLRLKKYEIGIPEPNTSYVDVPGMNGQLDLTDNEFGGVTYGPRTLSFYFDKRDCSYEDWFTLVSTIETAILGQKVHIILDDDPLYYYVGRCSVTTEKENPVLAEIVVECNCDPYKLDISATNEAWVWDTFNFETGSTLSTSDVVIDSPSGWQTVEITGSAYNETLTIVSNAALTMAFGEATYNIVAGENILYEAIIEEGTNYLYFMGSGIITIIQRGGRL